MKLRLIDIIDELTYWQNSSGIAQIVTVDDIKDTMLAKVMNLDGIQPGTRILIISDAKNKAINKQEKYKEKLKTDVRKGKIPESFKDAEPTKEYRLNYFPIDVSDKFELNEDNNVNIDSVHNLSILARLLKKNQPKILVVDDNIAKKIIVGDAHPIPYEPLKSLIQILLNNVAYLDNFSRKVLKESFRDYKIMRDKSNSYSKKNNTKENNSYISPEKLGKIIKKIDEEFDEEIDKGKLHREKREKEPEIEMEK